MNFLKQILKWVLIIFVIFIVMAIIMMFTFDGSSDINYNPALITISQYGEDYPYTIDNLTLKCDNQAVWVEDTALNKYALNGLAYSKLQTLPDFKGYSAEILIKGKSDFNFINKGLEFCK